MRTTDSDGEVLLVFEATTPRFHRYRGAKNNKDITLYIDHENGTYHPNSRIKAIVRIDERGEDRELSKRQEHAAAYGMSPFHLKSIAREAQFQRDRAESKKFRAEQLYFLASINGRLETLIEETKNANTQNNRSNRTKKRSKRSR